MKTLKFIFFVLTLFLGLAVAWNGLLPTQLSKGSIIGGDCWVCEGCDLGRCNEWPGAELCGSNMYRIECSGFSSPYAEYTPCRWMDVTPCTDAPGCDFLACFSCP